MTLSASRAVYIDASALTKLVVAEPETVPLRAFLAGRDAASSVIAAIEVRRAARRVGTERDADEPLASVRLVELSDDVVAAAARLDPPTLQTLDAIHLASALILGDRIDSFVAYDARLIEAARAVGLDVRSPA